MNIMLSGKLSKMPGLLSAHHYFRYRNMSTNATKCLKVTICGAAGNIGQPLALLLKQCPLIDELALYDVAPVCGIGTELNHVDTRCMVSAHQGPKNLGEALKDAKIVIVTASTPILKEMDTNDIFLLNAPILTEIAKAVVCNAPTAILGIVTSPLNSLVPMVSEVYKQLGCYDSCKIMGITTIDSMRANTMVAKCACLEPEGVAVPVIGGHSEETTIPVLSQTNPCLQMSLLESENLTSAIKTACRDAKFMKGGHSSASLASAYAIARFTISLAKGLSGEQGVIECAYARSDAVREVRYFSTPCILGPIGIQGNWGLPTLNIYESTLLGVATKALQEDIALGEKYVRDQLCSPPPFPPDDNVKKDTRKNPCKPCCK